MGTHKTLSHAERRIKIKQVLKSEQQLIHYELTTVEFFEHQTL
ncbi:protein of unknown function [Xenorhabdus nematophila AN6/1]|nr:protein of unknown function [Xenorhabdus nematophila AN6/1]